MDLRFHPAQSNKRNSESNFRAVSEVRRARMWPETRPSCPQPKAARTCQKESPAHSAPGAFLKRLKPGICDTTYRRGW